jgi:hypothetical protein
LLNQGVKMAAKTNGTRKGPRMITEILRLKEKGLGAKTIARALGISKNTVKSYLRQHEAARSDAAPGPVATALAHDAPAYSAPWAVLVDWEAVKAATGAGTQLYHYWEESVAASDVAALAAVPYSTFWREYRRRFPEVPLALHKIHPPGERAEADYKGKGDTPELGYVDRASGDFVLCRLFGNILCFSQLFYAEATRTERQLDMLPAMGRSFEYFGGVPHTSATDNTKAAVKRAHRYDPDYNPEFFRFCEHYGTAPVATRPRCPKDKNLIENVLGVFWRWARPKLKKKTFFSLGELNAYLLELLAVFNHRVQRKYGISRRAKFEQGEQEKLLPMPESTYQLGEWKTLTHHPDCHVQCGYNFYSAPWRTRGQELEVRVTPGLVELFHRLERVAIHVAAAPNHRGKYMTQRSHLPPAHQALLESTPQRALADAAAVGTATEKVVRGLIEGPHHPLLFLRRVQGILRLAKRHSVAELEAACAVVTTIGVALPRLADIEDIIKNTKGRVAAPTKHVNRQPNPNLRGQMTWATELN